jgi:hypothetical protein
MPDKRPDERAVPTARLEACVVLGGSGYRIALSPIFLQLRKLDHEHIESRVTRFEALRRRDVIDDEELARLTAQLTRVEDIATTAALPSSDEWLQCQSCRRLVRLTGTDQDICPVCKQRAR